jgi:hypothetical protein
MFPLVLTLTDKEVEVVRDGVESGSIANGLIDTEDTDFDRVDWAAVEAILSSKLSASKIVVVESAAESIVIERAFSDSTLFEAYDREESRQKAAMMRVARSLQRKLSLSFDRRISMPSELT